ncbi:hypothetical protein WR25_11578 [Diploscapter pachys]|uniref:Uncharacterized protein n=1 Tax=Diploscapter pachys TaxID=2018661 RepID=A0A2A2L0C2_9BILA|nr:hypothetical protein WR25_11578 [Diploscapter pachys]
MEELEERLENIERILGISDEAEISPSSVDVQSVKSLLTSRGANCVMKVPLEKLQKLDDLVMKKPESRASSYRTIEMCEDLIRQRAQLLEEFDNSLKVVLNTDSLTAVTSHEAELQKAEEDVKQALRIWKDHSREIESFKDELQAVLDALYTKLTDLEEKAAKLNSSEA